MPNKQEEPALSRPPENNERKTIAETEKRVDQMHSSVKKKENEKVEQKPINSPSSQRLSLAKYSALLSSIDQQDMVLHRKKNAKSTIQVVKTNTPNSLVLIKRSKTALKEFIQAAEAASSSDPLASLELLNKLQASTWGKQVLKVSPNLNKRFKATYENSLNKCVTYSRLQFTEFFNNVTSAEMLKNKSLAGKSDAEYEKESPNLFKVINRTNKIAFNVQNTILLKPKLKERTHTMAMYIRLASRAYASGDFASATAIFSGLSSFSITRLKNTINNLPPSIKALLADLEAKMGKVSADQAPKNRKLFLEKKFPLPFLPYIGDAFLSPLTLFMDKRNDFQNSFKIFTLANQFIDKLRGNSLDAHIISLKTEINALEEKTRVFKTKINALEEERRELKAEIKTLEKENQLIIQLTKESLDLTFQKGDLEIELKEALKTQLLMEHFDHLTSKNSFSNQTSDSLKEKINNFATNLEKKLSDLNNEHQEKIKQAKEKNISLDESTLNNYIQEREKLTLKIKVAEDWIKVVSNNLKALQNSPVDSSKLLNLISQRNVESLESFQLGIKERQKELDGIIEDFENLMKPIKDISVKNAEISNIPDWLHEDKLSELKTEKEMFDLSLKIEPRAVSTA